VVGSLNEDLRLRTRTVPAAGETVLGDPDWRLGGEGSDQAIAAARYGAAMLMIGRLGVDAGAEVPRCVRGRGDRLRTAEHQHGGRDRLGADRAGAGGGEPNHRRLRANLTLTGADVTGAAEQGRGAAVVLAQMEIPVDVVQAPFDTANGTTVLNVAPARSLPVGLLAAPNVLVVNGIELAMTTGLRGREPTDVAAILAACRSIPGPGAVIVTRGRPGQWWSTPAEPPRFRHQGSTRSTPLAPATASAVCWRVRWPRAKICSTQRGWRCGRHHWLPRGWGAAEACRGGTKSTPLGADRLGGRVVPAVRSVVDLSGWVPASRWGWR